MRELSTNAAIKAAIKRGSEPFNVIRVDWTSTASAYYSDRDYNGIKGAIKAISKLDTAIDLDTGGNATNISIELDDSDGTIKGLMNTIDIHKRPCSVFQMWDGLVFTDALLLFQGEISTPIVWDEGQRSVKFDVITQIHTVEVGFSPEEGQFSDVPNDLANHPWPLGFGDCIHVPATKIHETFTGTTSATVWLPDYTLPWKYQYVIYKLQNYQAAYTYYNDILLQAATIARNPDVIEEDYISLIVEEDPLKQQIEDFSAIVEKSEKLLKKLEDALEDAKEFGQESLIETIQNEIDDLNETLTEDQAELKTLTDQLKNLEAQKDNLNIEVSNAEYKFNTTKELTKKLNKLLENYFRSLVDLSKIELAIATQFQIQSFLIPIVGGERFPRGNIEILVNGMVLVGFFYGTGNVFQVTNILPRYTYIPVGPRLTDDINAFWLQTDNYQLKDHYLLLQNGLIVRVIDQVGLKCYVELIDRQTDDRFNDPNNSVVKQTDLDESTWSILGGDGAQEYTKKQREKILWDSIDNTPLRTELDDMKENIKQLQAVLIEEALNEDDFKAAQQAVYNNMVNFNDIVSKLSFPRYDVEKAESLISETEFHHLLRLENLQVAINEFLLFPPLPDIPRYGQGLYYATGYDVHGTILAASTYIPPYWLSLLPPGQSLTPLRDVIQLPNGQIIQASRLPSTTMWVAEAGSPATLVGAFQNKYIANILPSEVKAVYAYRGVAGFRRLVPVPLNYYVKNEADDYGVLTCTSISLIQPLSSYAGEDWQDDIFVTYTSSVGPNTADIIRWIVNTWTNFTVDDDSFNDVAAKLTNYPSNFALFDLQDAISLIKDIAYQARCSVWIIDNTVRIKYLAETPTSVLTITDSDIVDSSLSVELTPTEEVYTKFTNTYLPSYEQTAQPIKIILRHNFQKYGKVEKVTNYSIYNIHDLVLKSATFHMIRDTNPWKIVHCKLLVNKIALETFDAVTLDLTSNFVSTGPVIGLVQKADYDSDTNTIDLTLWTPVRSGEMTAYDFAFPASIPADTIFPNILDVSAGNAGNPLNTRIPTGTTYRINDDDGLADILITRPNDYGDPFPSDAGDTMPVSPITGYTEAEIDKFRVTTVSYTTDESLTDTSIGTMDYKNANSVQFEKHGVIIDNFLGVITAYNDNDSYQVRRPDSIVVTAESKITFAPELENGTKVHVTYNKTRNVYEFLYKQDKTTNIACSIIGLSDDFLICLNTDGDEILVAKPYQLRRTPFDNKTYGDIQYSYLSSITREALPVGGDPDHDTETQLIIPRYIEGDIIYAARIPGGTGIVANENELKWIDINVDGRAWAVTND